METKTKKTVKAVFTIIEDSKRDRPIFRRIGTAFVNRDESLSIKSLTLLRALPVSGRLHIRDAEVRKKGAA